MNKVTIISGVHAHESEDVLAVYESEEKANQVMESINDYCAEWRSIPWTNDSEREKLANTFPLGRKNADYDDYRIETFNVQQ